MLVVPENVHTGSPPFLKCGLAARAAEEVRTNAASIIGSAKRTIRTRRMFNSPLEFRSSLPYTLGKLKLTSRAGGRGHHRVRAL
jgi:hypothetical protein